MNTWLARLRPLVASLALPVGGIALSYNVFIDAPLRKQTTDAQAKVIKLAESVKARSGEHAANQRALESTVQTQRQISQLVSTTPQSAGAPSSTEPSSTVGQFVNVDSPLSTLSATLLLFSRHHLECLASEPDVGSTGRRTVRVTLHGSFANMHCALEEMQSALNCVSILSLEMESSSVGETTHQWILILLV